MRLTALLSIALALISTPLCSMAQTSGRFTLQEKQGPNAVGLKVVEQYDYSRTFQPTIDAMGKPYPGERARPLQTLIWYPAKKSDAKLMTFGDYVALQATETSFDNPKDLTGMEAMFIASMKPVFQQPMWATRDAALASGKFPVIIYAPSFSSVSWENVDLCEYLASYGYVVIAAPGMGVTRESTHDVAGTNAQAQDISFLIGFARTLPDTDLSEVGVVGFSWGGIANLFASARDNRIDALVALDGSMRYFPGVVKDAGDVHPDQMTIPLLYFKGQESLEDEAHLHDRFKSDGPNVLNEWTHGDLVSVQMLGLFHPEFSSKAQRNELLWKYEASGLQEADYDRQDGVIGYAWMARYTREFLDAYLKHNGPALQFLKNKPSDNAVPKHVLAVNFQPAKSMPASFTSLRVEAARQGFDHVADIYAAIQKDQPNFKVDADDVVSWAYDLLADGHLPEAIDVMKLAIQLDPSSRAYSSLGEMYAKAGQKQAAIDSYKTALEKDPNNIIATEGLKELGSGPSER